MNPSSPDQNPSDVPINGFDAASSLSSDGIDLEKFPRSDWRMELEDILNTHELHFFLIFLLVVDVLIVVASIALEIEYLESQVDDLKEFCTSGECPLAESTEIGNISLEESKELLFLFSITILSIFLLEFVLKITAVGLKQFLMNHILVFDMMVVIASIVLEMTLENSPEGGLLILARSWRFIRIGHGLYESIQARDKKEVAKLKVLRKMLSPYQIEISDPSSHSQTNYDSHFLAKICHAIDYSKVLDQN